MSGPLKSLYDLSNPYNSYAITHEHKKSKNVLKMKTFDKTKKGGNFLSLDIFIWQIINLTFLGNICFLGAVYNKTSTNRKRDTLF